MGCLLLYETANLLVSFAAVFLGCHATLPQRNGCSHPNHIPFPISANHSLGSIFKNLLAPNSPVQSEIVFYLFTVGAHHKSKMAALQEAFHLASSKFKISELNAYQKLAIRKIVVGKEDIFVNLPLGFGKSLIYLLGSVVA